MTKDLQDNRCCFFISYYYIIVGEITSGYYAFVTFYSANAATKAKDELKGVVILGDQECKVKDLVMSISLLRNHSCCIDHYIILVYTEFILVQLFRKL
jgi:hypothetical protein